MSPLSRAEAQNDRPARKLSGKTALIGGGDSGIGRAVALAFAKEGADIAIIYFNEHRDAEDARQLILRENVRCILIAGNVAREDFCRNAVKRTVGAFKRLDILVNSAAERHPQSGLQETTREQVERTFRGNLFGMFYLSNAAMPHLPAGGAIINTASVPAFRGSAHLIDRAATEGAIVSFTRSLAQALIDCRIRVNAVALGPAWTRRRSPDFAAQEGGRSGSSSSMERAAERDEIAPCYVFLAAEDASFRTGQVLHPNGGEMAA